MLSSWDSRVPFHPCHVHLCFLTLSPWASSSNVGAKTIVLQRLLNQLLRLGKVKSLRKVFNIRICLNPNGYILMYSTNKF